MSDLWFNYAIILFVMLLVVLVNAYYQKRFADVPRLLWLGALSGIVPGLICDLLIGKHLGLVSYALGFGPVFLVFNAVVGYGLFAVNTLLLQKTRFLSFCAWTLLITAGCEITNLFTRSYTYPFAVPSIEYWIVAFAGPLGLALAMALAWHLLFKYRFTFLSHPN